MNATLLQKFHVSGRFQTKAVAIIITEILTGISISLLINVNMGTDPGTFTNVILSERLGISFGNWMVMENAALFAIMFGVSRLRYVGLGTFANMILLGYSCDFGRFLWSILLPDSVFTVSPMREIIFAFALAALILFCAIYMNLQMGLAPYDALPFIISNHLPHIPFYVVRMTWDFSIIGIGLLVGGVPPIGVILMALFLGPVVTIVGHRMARRFPSIAGQTQDDAHRKLQAA